MLTQIIAESSTIEPRLSSKVKPLSTTQTDRYWFLFHQLEIVALDLNKPKECNLPKAIGPCKGAVPLFFYNSEKGTCESFWYGGCKVKKFNW